MTTAVYLWLDTTATKAVTVAVEIETFGAGRLVPI
jgi:hypothetical protein